MISWIIFLLFTITAVAMLIAKRKTMFTTVTVDRGKYDTSYDKQVFNPGYIVRPIIVFVLGIMIALIQPYRYERVDQGHVGLKVNLTGHERGVSDVSYQTGWVPYNSWFEMLYEYPVYLQHVEYDDQTVILKGGFPTTIKPTFNYKLKEEAAVDMFKELRLDIKSIEQGWLKTAIVGSVNDVANKWEVDVIFMKRQEFESAIIAECNKRVGKYFEIDQLRTNISPPDALKASIVAKTKAIQDAQAKMQEALVAEADAKKRIAVAKGDSAQAVINASGEAEAKLIAARSEAEATRLKQMQLTPLYIEYLRISKWDGSVPTTMLAPNTGSFINIK